MELKKNELYEIKITDIGINGEGIGKINNFTVFVNNTLPNEIAKIKLIKLKKNYGYGKLIELIQKSDKRVVPPCDYFHKCGGCNLLHLSYTEQLNLKTNTVKNTLEKIGKLKNINVLKTLGMKHPFNYRNKAQIPVNSNNQTINIGFFSPRSHNIINIDNCIIQDKITSQIIKLLREFIIENKIKPYNEINNKGLIRHIVTRTNKTSSELVICLVINSKSNFPYEAKFIEKFKNIPNLKGIVLNFNPDKTNVILGKKTKTIFGQNYITDYINDLKFKISMLSFYQVNPIQTEILYNKVLEFANLKGTETVIDAYCGIGTISLFIAKNAKLVYGIEIIEEAVQDAKLNAKINNLNNTNFITGKSEEVIPQLITKEKIFPDIIILDPPRKGCDNSMLKTIVNSKIPKIIYVSCNPSTLARDLNYLCENGYILEKIQPVDMFCHSTHVETVVLMSRVDK